MGDRDMDEYRRVLSAIVLPEMVFHLNRVELVHEASGTVIAFNALDALAGWKLEDLPPLQVRVAEEWRKAREHEIQQQKAVQLTYDWTFTTPYTCTVIPGGGGASGPSDGTSAAPAPQPSAAGTPPGQLQPAASIPAPSPRSSESGGFLIRHGVPDFVCGTTGPAVPVVPAAQANASSTGSSGCAAAADTTTSPEAPGASPANAAPSAAPSTAPSTAASANGGGGNAGGGFGVWEPTTDQIDRGLLMERDPILFYDEVPLYESDLDDNGVCAVTVKLRVMPRCWLVLLRLWVRVDGSMVRLRETRLFCRHDKADKRLDVLQEVKHCEGSFAELRSRGAPDEGPAYADADAASQVFQAVAPVGLKLLQTRKLRLPPSPPHSLPAAAAAGAAAGVPVLPGPASCPPPPPPAQLPPAAAS